MQSIAITSDELHILLQHFQAEIMAHSDTRAYNSSERVLLSRLIAFWNDHSESTQLVIRDEQPEMTLPSAVKELRSMAESLEIDVPSDAGYVERVRAIADFLDSM